MSYFPPGSNPHISPNFSSSQSVKLQTAERCPGGGGAGVGDGPLLTLCARPLFSHLQGQYLRVWGPSLINRAPFFYRFEPFFYRFEPFFDRSGPLFPRSGPFFPQLGPLFARLGGPSFPLLKNCPKYKYFRPMTYSMV